MMSTLRRTLLAGAALVLGAGYVVYANHPRWWFTPDLQDSQGIVKVLKALSNDDPSTPYVPTSREFGEPMSDRRLFFDWASLASIDPRIEVPRTVGQAIDAMRAQKAFVGPKQHKMECMLAAKGNGAMNGRTPDELGCSADDIRGPDHPPPITMPITPGVPENTGTFGPQTAAETAAAQATVDRTLSNGPPNLTGMTIQQCYHPDSCGTVKILSMSLIETKGSARLIKANVRFGDIVDPDKPRNIRWKQTSEVYALCSAGSPIVAWHEGGSFLAEEFDFAGEGISGVQQNNAGIYEALCHGFFNGELEARAKALGYRPLPNGGRGQFTVKSLDDLW
jgi:hypothetical protein